MPKLAADADAAMMAPFGPASARIPVAVVTAGFVATPVVAASVVTGAIIPAVVAAIIVAVRHALHMVVAVAVAMRLGCRGQSKSACHQGEGCGNLQKSHGLLLSEGTRQAGMGRAFSLASG